MRLTKILRWNIILIFGIVVSNLVTVFLLFGNNEEDAERIIFSIPDKIVLHYKNEVMTIDQGESYFDEIVELNQMRTDIVEYFVEVNDNGNFFADEYYMEYCYEEPYNMSVETRLERKTYPVSKLCFILTGEQNNCIRFYSDNEDLLGTVGQLNSNTDLIRLCAGLIGK